jgi:hypothetical protein
LECVQFIWNRSIKLIAVVRVFLKINQKVEEKSEMAGRYRKQCTGAKSIQMQTKGKQLRYI